MGIRALNDEVNGVWTTPLYIRFPAAFIVGMANNKQNDIFSERPPGEISQNLLNEML